MVPTRKLSPNRTIRFMCVFPDYGVSIDGAFDKIGNKLTGLIVTSNPLNYPNLFV
ncbi:MAG: hypothetical protein ACW99J_19240 [Candidatus Thorarchaeota archaeon]|jgi:hypothetical protein